MNFVPILTIILSHGLIDYCFTSGVDTGLIHLRKQISKSTKKDVGRKFVNLDMDIINSYINVSFDDCIWKCHKKSRCRAIEYRRKTNYCALVWKYGEIETQPGSYIAHDFVNTDQKQCGNRKCNRKETCAQKQDESHCSIEECRNPMAGQVVDGNIYTPGSKIISNCYTYFAIRKRFVCSSTGEWLTTAGRQAGITCAELENADSYVLPNSISIVTNKLGMTLRCYGTNSTWMTRRYGVLDFNRDWEDYKYGFGHVCGDYWMGLEDIHTIMEKSSYTFSLRLELLDWNKTLEHVVYRDFYIQWEKQMYQLRIGSYFGGIAGNALGISNGVPFSTYDSIADPKKSTCIDQLQGGWWYNDCHGANLNGRYYWRGELTGNEGMSGVTWYTWHGYNYSLKKVNMRMKEEKPKWKKTDISKTHV